MNNFTCLSFFYLRVLHDLHCAVKGRPQRRKADNNIHLGVLPHGICDVLIDWQQDLFVAPIELLLVITTRQNKCYIRLFKANGQFYMISSINLRERVDHSCHRGFISGANIVKVQHALNSTRLHAPNNGLGLLSEECGGFGWGEKVRETSELETGKDCIKRGEGRDRLRGKASMQLLISKLQTLHTLRTRR